MAKRARPDDKRTLDPAKKTKAAPTSVTMSQLVGDNGKPMRLVGASLGATIQIGKNYMRFDCWESCYVEDEPKKVEKAKRKLAARLRAELELQHQEAEEELIEDEE